MRVPVVLLLCLTVASAADRCSPPNEIAEFLSALPAEGLARTAAIEERLKQTPDSLTLHRMIVDASVYHKEAVRDRYRRLLESHPGSLDYQYLQARSLVGSDTRRALQLYAQILNQDPDYPWVHLSQLEIYRAEAFRDRARLAESFVVMQRVCPTLLQPYTYINQIADNDLAARAAQKLRMLLQGANTVRDLRLYSTLWAVEFRVRPAAEHDEERKQVTEDLKRLEPFDSDPRIRYAMENGAKLTGDTALTQRLAAKRELDVAGVVMEKSNSWLRQHPQPKLGDSREVRHAYGAELLVKAGEWRKLAPGEVTGNYNRLAALGFLDASPDEIGRAGDEFLALVRGKGGLMASWITTAARIYVDAGVLLDRAVALCAEAIRLLDDPEAVIEIDLAPSPRMTADNRQELVIRHVEALVVLAQAHEKLGNRDKAHAALWEASDYLASKAPASDPPNPQLLMRHAIARHGILRASAEMAEREGRKLDALTGYREALLARPLAAEELMARQRKLWKELGGSDEGWQQWATPVSKPAPKAAGPAYREGSAEKRKLPPLAVRDLNGRQWTLDSLAGKTTIAVVWATWCEPCRAELPYFAKLVDRLKDRDDVLPISFNTDENIALAEAFAKAKAYTFPVLAARQYAEDLMPVSSIPRTWIIRDGVITKEYQGFSPNGDKWIEDVLAALH